MCIIVSHGVYETGGGGGAGGGGGGGDGTATKVRTPHKDVGKNLEAFDTLLKKIEAHYLPTNAQKPSPPSKHVPRPVHAQRQGAFGGLHPDEKSELLPRRPFDMNYIYIYI